MSYIKQHELGLAGLALLRTWLIGDENIIKIILNEIYALTEDKLLSIQKEIKKYDVQAGYQAWATTYDSVPNLLIEVEEPVVKSLLREFSPGDALDAGCGTGRYSKYLQFLGHKVTGVDISPAMLHKARAGNRKINFIKSALTTLPLENESFDLAVCALALTHLPNLRPAISELFRVVRPGGHIIISDIHPWLVALGGQADFHDKAGHHGYITNYVHWHSNYLQVFKDIGLKVQQCIEPKMGQSHVKLAQSGFDLSEKTVSVALQGLPIALIWVLKKL